MRLTNIAGRIARLGETAAIARLSRASGKSMPLSETPCVPGSRPVRIDARVGWHTKLGVMQAEKRVPSRASMSRCGVFTLRPSKP